MTTALHSRTAQASARKTNHPGASGCRARGGGTPLALAFNPLWLFRAPPRVATNDAANEYKLDSQEACGCVREDTPVAPHQAHVSSHPRVASGLRFDPHSPVLPRPAPHRKPAIGSEVPRAGAGQVLAIMDKFYRSGGPSWRGFSSAQFSNPAGYNVPGNTRYRKHHHHRRSEVAHRKRTRVHSRSPSEGTRGVSRIVGRSPSRECGSDVLGGARLRHGRRNGTGPRAGDLVVRTRRGRRPRSRTPQPRMPPRQRPGFRGSSHLVHASRESR